MAFVGELATSAASSLIGELIKRPIAAIAAEMQRRNAVSRSLNDRATPRVARLARSAELSVADLARVIGNVEGLLTEEVADYLRELQRTAIPEAVAQCAICGRPAAQLAHMFNAFHERFHNIPFTSTQILNALYAAVLERIESVQDKALLEILRAQHTELQSRLDLVIRALNPDDHRHERMNIDEIKSSRIRVAKLIESSNRYVTVETLQGSKKYPLRSLAIPARLIELRPSHIESAKIPADDRTTPYLAFRRNFNRAILLGDPGGGKSTMTQQISFDLANVITAEHSNPERKDFDPRDLKLPLKIILRSFESKQQINPSYNFIDAVRDDIKLALDNNGSLAERFLKEILSSGGAVVIFDGLDEVLDVGARRNMVSHIEQFSEIYAACPILVTSRLVGYRDAPLDENFTPSGLARFHVNEIKSYSEKAIKAVSRSSLKEAKEKAIEFLRQTNKIGGDIRENPLMLGLMVQIFVYRGDVPSNRPEVYKECATLMFERWDGRRDIVADVPRQEIELLDVFGYVASRIFGDAKNEEGVSKQWLTIELRRHFDGWFVDRASANKAANSLVDFLTGRAWVMSEVGHEVFKFTHRTFLEYFFARHLISESRGIGDLIDRDLIPRLINNEWVLISHLALHMAVFRDGGKARQASECIGRNLQSLQLSPNQELPFLEFVAAAMDYILIPEQSYINLIERVVARAMLLGAKETFAAASVLWTLFTTANHREDLATKAISDAVMKSLSSPGRPEFMFSLYLLGARRQDGLRDTSLHAKPSTLWHKMSRIRSDKKRDLFNLALRHVDIAKAYIYVYDKDMPQLYKKHGKAMVAPSGSAISPPGADQIIPQCLEKVTDYFRDNNRIGDDSKDIIEQAEFVSMIAHDISMGDIDFDLINSNHWARVMTESELENALHNVWLVTRRKKRIGVDKDVLADALVCIFRISDQLNAVNTSEGKRRRGGALAPVEVIQEMIRAVTPCKHDAFFDRWISEKLPPEEAGTPES